MTKTITVHHTDGTDRTIPMMYRLRIKADKHLKDNGLGTPDENQAEYIGYAAYAAERMNHWTDKPFDQWLDTVEDIELTAGDGGVEENPTD